MYKDEEILKAKKAIEEEKKKNESAKNLVKEAEESIYDEKVHILGTEVKFEERIIEELGISIYMPETFFRFTDDLAKMVYPGGNSPSHVFGGENINFQMIFNRTQHTVSDDKMKEFMDLTSKVLKTIGPKVTIVEKKVVEKEDYHIGIMSFVSRAIDIMVFNVQYYVSLNGKLLMGGITFPSRYKKRFIPMAEEIITSLTILKEEE